MKKLILIILAFAIAASLVACGCSRSMDSETSNPTTNPPTTEPSVLPDILPTMETNIPDPSVDTQMPVYTEGEEATDRTEPNGNTTASESTNK
jgi:hypothetical protein